MTDSTDNSDFDLYDDLLEQDHQEQSATFEESTSEPTSGRDINDGRDDTLVSNRDLDLYEDLIAHDKQEQSASNDELSRRFESASELVQQLESENISLKQQLLSQQNHVKALQQNFAHLLKTARGEIARKEKEIANLRQGQKPPPHRGNRQPAPRKSSVDSSLDSTFEPLFVSSPSTNTSQKPDAGVKPFLNEHTDRMESSGSKVFSVAPQCTKEVLSVKRTVSVTPIDSGSASEDNTIVQYNPNASETLFSRRKRLINSGKHKNRVETSNQIIDDKIIDKEHASQKHLSLIEKNSSIKPANSAVGIAQGLQQSSCDSKIRLRDDVINSAGNLSLNESKQTSEGSSIKEVSGFCDNSTNSFRKDSSSAVNSASVADSLSSVHEQSTILSISNSGLSEESILNRKSAAANCMTSRALVGIPDEGISVARKPQLLKHVTHHACLHIGCTIKINHLHPHDLAQSESLTNHDISMDISDSDDPNDLQNDLHSTLSSDIGVQEKNQVQNKDVKQNRSSDIIEIGYKHDRLVSDTGVEQNSDTNDTGNKHNSHIKSTGAKQNSKSNDAGIKQKHLSNPGALEDLHHSGSNPHGNTKQDIQIKDHFSKQQKHSIDQVKDNVTKLDKHRQDVDSKVDKQRKNDVTIQDRHGKDYATKVDTTQKDDSTKPDNYRKDDTKHEKHKTYDDTKQDHLRKYVGVKDNKQRKDDETKQDKRGKYYATKVDNTEKDDDAKHRKSDGSKLDKHRTYDDSKQHDQLRKDEGTKVDMHRQNGYIKVDKDRKDDSTHVVRDSNGSKVDMHRKDDNTNVNKDVEGHGSKVDKHINDNSIKQDKGKKCDDIKYDPLRKDDGSKVDYLRKDDNNKQDKHRKVDRTTMDKNGKGNSTKQDNRRDHSKLEKQLKDFGNEHDQVRKEDGSKVVKQIKGYSPQGENHSKDDYSKEDKHSKNVGAKDKDGKGDSTKQDNHKQVGAKPDKHNKDLAPKHELLRKEDGSKVDKHINDDCSKVEKYRKDAGSKVLKLRNDDHTKLDNSRKDNESQVTKHNKDAGTKPDIRRKNDSTRPDKHSRKNEELKQDKHNKNEGSQFNKHTKEDGITPCDPRTDDGSKSEMPNSGVGSKLKSHSKDDGFLPEKNRKKYGSEPNKPTTEYSTKSNKHNKYDQTKPDNKIENGSFKYDKYNTNDGSKQGNYKKDVQTIEDKLSNDDVTKLYKHNKYDGTKNENYNKDSGSDQAKPNKDHGPYNGKHNNDNGPKTDIDNKDDGSKVDRHKKEDCTKQFSKDPDNKLGKHNKDDDLDGAKMDTSSKDNDTYQEKHSKDDQTNQEKHNQEFDAKQNAYSKNDGKTQNSYRKDHGSNCKADDNKKKNSCDELINKDRDSNQTIPIKVSNCAIENCYSKDSGNNNRQLSKECCATTDIFDSDPEGQQNSDCISKQCSESKSSTGKKKVSSIDKNDINSNDGKRDEHCKVIKDIKRPLLKENVAIKHAYSSLQPEIKKRKYEVKRVPEQCTDTSLSPLLLKLVNAVYQELDNCVGHNTCLGNIALTQRDSCSEDIVMKQCGSLSEDNVIKQSVFCPEDIPLKQSSLTENNSLRQSVSNSVNILCKQSDSCVEEISLKNCDSIDIVACDDINTVGNVQDTVEENPRAPTEYQCDEGIETTSDVDKNVLINNPSDISHENQSSSDEMTAEEEFSGSEVSLHEDSTYFSSSDESSCSSCSSSCSCSDSGTNLSSEGSDNCSEKSKARYVDIAKDNTGQLNEPQVYATAKISITEGSREQGKIMCQNPTNTDNQLNGKQSEPEVNMSGSSLIFNKSIGNPYFEVDEAPVFLTQKHMESNDHKMNSKVLENHIKIIKGKQIKSKGPQKNLSVSPNVKKADVKIHTKSSTDTSTDRFPQPTNGENDKLFANILLLDDDTMDFVDYEDDDHLQKYESEATHHDALKGKKRTSNDKISTIQKEEGELSSDDNSHDSFKQGELINLQNTVKSIENLSETVKSKKLSISPIKFPEGVKRIGKRNNNIYESSKQKENLKIENRVSVMEKSYTRKEEKSKDSSYKTESRELYKHKPITSHKDGRRSSPRKKPHYFKEVTSPKISRRSFLDDSKERPRMHQRHDSNSPPCNKRKVLDERSKQVGKERKYIFSPKDKVNTQHDDGVSSKNNLSKTRSPRSSSKHESRSNKSQIYSNSSRHDQERHIHQSRTPTRKRKRHSPDDRSLSSGKRYHPRQRRTSGDSDV
ncbi:putative uncharacterized protein DDB_G0282133 [Dreissena polymorpha]|uniref:Uncharacterized protein n=1 Tax=Dreissena polymorpha TaxID=45954 RepID=A0A9D4N6L1_DREPO|nr:putative uncharacterized protein DDB_G0282133 [Dreissena polymorpha]KAH3888966.1 hypothetical protein DPMN_013011 [Dreissena polymorpha]